MSKYLVVLVDSSPLPFDISDPLRGGKGQWQSFAHLPEARSFAETQKDKWERVCVYVRADNGSLEPKVHYHQGMKYLE